MLCAHDAGGHAVFEAHRVADRHDPFAGTNLVRIAQWDGLQRRVNIHLDQGDVGFLVDPNDLGVVLLPV